MKLYFCILFLAGLSISSASQDNGLLVGKASNMILSTASYYDLSDPTGINIEVNIWGFVRLPGKYKVPYTTTFQDLMSYAGGPLENSNLTDIRILRQGTDSINEKTELIKLNYNDLLWEDKVQLRKMINPQLKSGDVVLILQEKRYNMREDISFYLPIFTTFITIVTLIITLRK